MAADAGGGHNWDARGREFFLELEGAAEADVLACLNTATRQQSPFAIPLPAAGARTWKLDWVTETSYRNVNETIRRRLKKTKWTEPPHSTICRVSAALMTPIPPKLKRKRAPHAANEL